MVVPADDPVADVAANAGTTLVRLEINNRQAKACFRIIVATPKGELYIFEVGKTLYFFSTNITYLPNNEYEAPLQHLVPPRKGHSWSAEQGCQLALASGCG
jgi:hypothetical protein